MDKLKAILKSRTVQTVIVTFLVNGAAAITDFVPQQWLPLVNGILGILAVYFRIKPKQQF